MIGEKIGFIPVEPHREFDKETGKLKTCWDRFSYADAARKLDKNQSYSQALICIAAMEKKMPEDVNLDCRKWILNGLSSENQRLSAAGMETVKPASIRPQFAAEPEGHGDSMGVTDNPLVPKDMPWLF